jgi:hypothetical protein
MIVALACLATLLPLAMRPVLAQEAAGTVRADLLWYDEQEPGTEVYPVRIIVSRGFVRIDDDDDDGDFALLDRATFDLYTVTREERNILEIPYRHLEPRRPDDLRLDEEIERDESAPAIAGKSPLLVSLRANGDTCYHVAAVPGLLEEAVAGLADYARVLGNRQFGNLRTVPADMQTPCFLAHYVYAPARHLQHGLPILEWDDNGYRRALISYQADETVAAALFVLPEGYERVTLGTASDVID